MSSVGGEWAVASGNLSSRLLDRAYCGLTCLSVLDITSKVTETTKDYIITLTVTYLPKSMIDIVTTSLESIFVSLEVQNLM